jgi:cytochrome P450
VGEDELGGVRIPADSVIIISSYVNHRMPRFWNEPERFDPDRFLPELEESRDTYAYFPFGGGPHTCIGKHLSLVEVKVAAAMMAQQYRFQLIPGQTIRPLPRISLRPEGEIRMHLLRR